MGNGMTDQADSQAQAPQPTPETPLPLLVCHGEGYVTKPDGTVIPFTLHGETK